MDWQAIGPDRRHLLPLPGNLYAHWLLYLFELASIVVLYYVCVSEIIYIEP